MPDRTHIAELKSAADPLRAASALGLRSRGGRFFCPVCQSDGRPHKTPDLVIGDKGIICHKCGLKGDLLKLIMVAGNLDFPKAVAWLERETGLTRPSSGRPAGGYHHKGRGEIGRPARSWAPVVPRSDAQDEETPDPAVYDAFLAACRPVDGRVLDWLTKDKGIAPAVIEDMKIRFCGREYPDIMKGLKDRFGDAELVAAGLLKRSKKGGRLVPSFWHYYTRKAGFLVIPYLRDGRAVYLKVRPPVSKAEAERRRLSRFLNTAAAVPCLYNVDTLKDDSDKVLICEGESDTWTALSCGVAAVGSPGARLFKEAWVDLFRGFRALSGRSRVYLVMDADPAGAEGSRKVADLFMKAGLPVPLAITLFDGQDLNDYIKGGMTA